MQNFLEKNSSYLTTEITYPGWRTPALFVFEQLVFFWQLFKECDHWSNYFRWILLKSGEIWKFMGEFEKLCDQLMQLTHSFYKKLSRENKLLEDKQSWSPPSMVSYFCPTISISIGLVPRMLIRLYCSTLWTGPCKGVKQETHHSWLFMEIQIQIASYCSRSNLIQGGAGE